MIARANDAGVFLATLVAICVLAVPAKASLLRTGKATVVNGNELIVSEVPFRLRDADAFELGQECWSAKSKFDCGAKAKEPLDNIVDGKTVFCGGPGANDAFCLAGKEVNIAEEMIRRGWALARPDRAFDAATAKVLCALEGEAKRLKHGAWSYRFALPYFHRGEKDKTREQVSCGNAPVLSP